MEYQNEQGALRPLLTGTLQTEDTLPIPSIRPQRLSDYIGQTRVRTQLEIFIRAAELRGDALDHVLILGPPGLGKTTLAHIIAHERGVNLKQTSGPVIEKAGDLAALLTNLEHHDVLFIDEIHRLNPAIEEILYPALEDCRLDIMIGEGPSARSIKIDLPPFTLVGATTRMGLLTAPLRDRFGIIQQLEWYRVQDLAIIIKRSATILNITIEEAATYEIARRARGTPRIANRLLRRVRDYAEVKSNGILTQSISEDALSLLHVDQRGFDILDQKLLHILVQKFQGGPAGLETLAAALGEESGTIAEVIEPYLIQEGFILRTPRGRIATTQAYTHMGLTDTRPNRTEPLTWEESTSS